MVVYALFALVGASMLIGACFIATNTLYFTAKAQLTEGRVVENVRRRSGDSDTYYPVVEFVTTDGQHVQVMSSPGSTPPTYDVGESVDVLYRPDNIDDARINSFLSLWLGAIIMGSIGSVFFFIGAGLPFLQAREKRRNERLKATGKPVDAKFCHVELNERYSVNSRHPYRVVCQWQNPATGKIHVFNSNNIWFDPTAYINKESLTVFIDRNNPKTYVVDISFLPEVAA